MSNDTPDIVIERELQRADTWVAYLVRVDGQLRELRQPLEREDEGQCVDREAQRLRQFNHPNLPRLVGGGLHEGRAYLLLEAAAGPTLETLLARGAIPWQQVLEIARPLASALKYAHDRGLILGEVSLRTLACVSEPGSTWPVVRLSSFPPPVRKPGDPSVGPRAEVYGLGRVLLTLLLGREPAATDPLRGLPAGIPGELRVLLERILDVDPASRLADGNTLCRQLDKVRDSLNEPAPSAQETKEATAALVSQYVREELASQNEGGPVARLFKKAWVVVPLFVLCVGTLVWTFWPASQDSLYRGGAELMESDDPDDWAKAFRDHFDVLDARFPDHPHKAKLAEFRLRLTQSKDETEAAKLARHAGPMSEAQWAYQEALRRRQVGDEAGARLRWQALVTAFGAVPSEGPWVRLAKQRLADERPEEIARQRQRQPLAAAQARVQGLRNEGKDAEADALKKALETLFPDDKIAVPK